MLLLKVCILGHFITFFYFLPPNNLSHNVHVSTVRKNTLMCITNFDHVFCPYLLESQFTLKPTF